MTDKKLTDSEIIKALECCGSPCNICAECPMPNNIKDDCKCGEHLANYALDLINRLQAENERLRNHIQEGIDLAKQIPEMMELVKAEAYKKCIEKAKSEIDSQSHSRSLEASGERFRIHKILDNLSKEMVGEDNV